MQRQGWGRASLLPRPVGGLGEGSGALQDRAPSMFPGAPSSPATWRPVGVLEGSREKAGPRLGGCRPELASCRGSREGKRGNSSGSPRLEEEPGSFPRRGSRRAGWGGEASIRAGDPRAVGTWDPTQEVYTTQDPVQGKAEVQSRGALPTGGPRVSLSRHPVPGTADAPPGEGLLGQECGASSPGRLGPHPHQGPCPP